MTAETLAEALLDSLRKEPGFNEIRAIHGLKTVTITGEFDLVRVARRLQCAAADEARAAYHQITKEEATQ